ncbi:MAG: hypothetical protein IJK94_07755 [Bacteroidaceae bacterium]|nr:hypothetical protein [Bacteroidaceae bacterium]
MQEGLGLEGIGLNLGQCPVLGKASEVIEYNIHLCIREVQFIDEDALSLGVGVKRNLIVVLAQTEAAQCPRHQVVLGMKPAKGMLQRILSSCPESLYDAHDFV